MIPVLVGVGQFSERLGEEAYAALSPADLAARAAEDAFADSGLSDDALARLRAAVDVVGVVRQFDQSFPGAWAPLGVADNIPRAITKRLGINPARAIHEPSGGQSPQKLVTELAGEIAAGRARAALVVGAEAISTTLAHAALDPDDRHGVLDFSETAEGQVEDRGYGLAGLVSQVQVLQRLDDAPTQYSVFENARRSRLGLSRAEHAQEMGRLFAPFTEVASRNPHSSTKKVRTAEELMTVTDDNRWIVDPYPKYVVSRDKVNMSAAVVLTTDELATELGIPQDKWVYLRGHADLNEQGLLDRADLAAYPAAWTAIDAALDMAGLTVADLTTIDLYSCFPVAVSMVCDGIGLAEDDPRGLTVTGGLPFFGGPGNDYALHAIAQTVVRLRETPGHGLVGANGGTMSKYSAGVYSTTAAPWVESRSTRLQAELDAKPTVPFTMTPDGWATIETWTVKYLSGGRRLGVILGRLEDGRRFGANTVDGDDTLLEVLLGEDVAGTRIFVRSHGRGNLASVSPERLAEVAPVAPVGFRETYDHLDVRRDGHLLHVAIHRPDARNALTPEAHQELSDVFDAYQADRDLWVAILSGDEVAGGGRVFCPGDDLMYGLTGKPSWLPTSGAGGLTSRTGLTKPVIAAIDGEALDVGLEIALACHLVVAAEDASLGLQRVRLGYVAGAGGPQRLLAALPPQVAYELVLTGRAFSPLEAQQWGIVNRLAPSGGAVPAAEELARELMAASPSAQSILLRLMAGVRDDDPVSPVDDVMVSFDALEGNRALVAGTPPEWRNR